LRPSPRWSSNRSSSGRSYGRIGRWPGVQSMLAAVGWLWAWRTLRRLPTTPGEPGAEPPPYPPPGDPGVGGTATVDRFRRRDDRGQDGQQGKRPGRSTPAMFPRTPPANSRTGPPPSTGRRRRRRLASLFRVRSPSPQRYPAPRLHLGGGAGGLLPHIGHDRAVASTQVLSSASGPISGGSRPRIRRWLRSDGGVARWRPPPRRPPKQQRQVAGAGLRVGGQCLGIWDPHPVFHRQHLAKLA
jgi:hypothetical protein